jgi:broad specificity phosphatase PhoE
MSSVPPQGGLVLVRHGETEWSLSGRHTGLTDIPLTEHGREEARALSKVLDPATFDRVLCSPLERARETCALAGFADGQVEIVEDLHEWDYGEYEGVTTDAIRQTRPDWYLWRDGCPGGESPEQVAARADRVIELRVAGATIAFAHGHFLRMVGARWAGLAPAAGGHLLLSPATVSALGFERDVRVLSSWNASSL